MTLSLIPGAVVGVILAIILIVVGLPIVAVAALVVVTAAVSLWIWRTAPGAVVAGVGARPGEESEHPRLHNLVDGLCATMGLPRPAIFVVDSLVPNAMAVGRDPASSVLIVTSALDEALSLVELEGVLAHELVHIKRQDTVLSAVAVRVVAPWAAVRGSAVGAATVHSLIGCGREYSADQRAAEVVRYPSGVESALDVMINRSSGGAPWPPGPGSIGALTRWLWIDPLAGGHGESLEGNLDDTRVRAAALGLR
jgi:heat shock protein HtpX